MSDNNANPQAQGQSNQQAQGAPSIPSLDNMPDTVVIGDQGMPNGNQGQQGQQQGQQGQQQAQQGFQATLPVDFKPDGAGQQSQDQNQGQGQGNQEPGKEGQQQQGQQGTPDNSPLEEYSFLSGDGKDLPADLVELRSNVFNLFGASQMDTQGNLLDSNGKVVLSKANLDKYTETGEVPTDNNGNQVREDGSILRSLEDNSPNFVDATRELVEETFKLQLLDKDGKPKAYDNTVEGQVAMINDIYQNGVVNAVAQFLNATPQVKDFYYHLVNGGKPEEYNFKPVDYSAMDVSQMDKSARIGIIKTSLEKQGVQNTENLIKTFELASDEIIEKSAAEALLTLDALTKEDRAKREADYNARVAKDKENAQAYWKEVESAVTENKIANLTIPDSEKEDFLKYLAMPVNPNGLTQNMIDEDEQGLDKELMIAYMRYKGFKFDDLIALRSKTGKLDVLKKRFAGKVPNPQLPNQQRQTQQQGTSFDLTLDKIVGNQQRN